MLCQRTACLAHCVDFGHIVPSWSRDRFAIGCLGTASRPASGNRVETATCTKNVRSFLVAGGPGRPTLRLRLTPASAACRISSWYSPSDYARSSSRRNHLQCLNMDASACQSGRPVPHGRRCDRSGFDQVIDLLKVAKQGKCKNIYLVRFQLRPSTH